jgi:NADPH-dependent curcumin reductase CurA
MDNRRVVLAQRPHGRPVASDFRIETVAVAEPGAGQVVVAVDTLGIDAFIRTVLEARSYHGSVPIGGTVTALGVGTVVASAAETVPVGTTVYGPLGVQTHATVSARALKALDVSRLPATAHLGPIGLTTGVTAYMGMVEVGHVGAGDVVVVSGAAGAVGCYAGQIAKLLGAGTVIGIAGGPDKARFLIDDLGYDAAIDYRAGDIGARLGELAPDGFDVFFDNVGGVILDTALLHMKEQARVVICGAISQYEDMDHVAGPTNYLKLAERHARMEGFAVTHFGAQLPAARAQLTEWLTGGELVVAEQLEHGIDRFAEVLGMLFTGGNRGKLLLQVR